MTKIDVVSGFLGAGKTTLIKKLLKEALDGSRVVLIENEFGEIGIDGGFLKEAGIEIKEMNSGCICCSLVGDFGASLKEVLDTYAPERIIIEPSGVGKLSDVVKAVQDVVNDADVKLNSAVAVVDVSKCRMYIKNFGEFFLNQIEHAGTILLSRTDKAAPEKVKGCVEMLREHNGRAVIVTTPWDELDGKDILATIEGTEDLEAQLVEEMKRHGGEECGCHGHHHQHGEGCCGHDHDEEGHSCGHDHDGEGHSCGHNHDGEGHSCGHDHDGEGHSCGHDHDGEGHSCGHDHDGEGHSCGHDHDEEGHSCGHDHDGEGHSHDHAHGEAAHVHEHGESCGHDHHHEGHHHADEVFTSWGMETPAQYTEDEIRGFLDQLEREETYGLILRAKGMLPSDSGDWIYFDYVPGESDLRRGKPDVTGKVCVIGSALKEDALGQLFGR